MRADRLSVWQDNNYIQKWYRREMTLGESMWSVFGLHNETANIYSHLAGTYFSWPIGWALCASTSALTYYINS